jgi:hypothetical protein
MIYVLALAVIWVAVFIRIFKMVNILNTITGQQNLERK